MAAAAAAVAWGFQAQRCKLRLCTCSHLALMRRLLLTRSMMVFTAVLALLVMAALTAGTGRLLRALAPAQALGYHRSAGSGAGHA